MFAFGLGPAVKNQFWSSKGESSGATVREQRHNAQFCVLFYTETLLFFFTLLGGCGKCTKIHFSRRLNVELYMSSKIKFDINFDME